ncbi:MAG: hypothetical protein ACRDZR_18240 [Acidimicrobiales bacterium]
MTVADLDLSAPRREVAGPAGAQELFQVNGWSDGLPIVPPTPELVGAAVAAAGLHPDEVVVELREQSRTVTVEQVAVNAVAAGCRPEYLPVVVTAMRAMGEEQYNLHSTTVSGATAPLVVVSGAAVELLGLNSGFSVFGSGHVANATIGRAVRLCCQNLCGGSPGVVDKATMGHPGKYSYCIGESPVRNPWPPMHTDRGLPAGASAVTVFAGEAPIFARNDWSSEPGPVLGTVADAMKVSHYTGGSFVVVLGPLHAGVLASAGMDRAAVREELFERSARSVADLKRAGRVRGEPEPGDEEERRRAVEQPDDIVVLVAGGHLYGYSAVVPPWVGGHESKPVTRELGQAELNACRIGA